MPLLTLDDLGPDRDDHAAAFWANVQIGSDRDCWPYVGPGTRHKYGHVQVSWPTGRKIYAHRLAFVFEYGEIPEDLILMHLCDVGGCANVKSHVILGTVAQNNAMRDARNRRTPNLPKGAQHWSSKLSERDVRAMRAARELNVPAKALAAMYDVSLASVYNCWSKIHYAEVA